MVKDPIKKAKNGTYYFRANLGYDSKGKKIQKYRSGFTTKKEAREEYSKLLLMKPEELSENKDKMTFKHYIFEIFLPWYKTQVKLRTYENRLPTIKKHFSYFDKMAVSDIEPIDVQNWQLKLSKKCKSSYVRAVQGLFSVAMDRAIVLGITTTNPSKIIGNVKKQKSKIEFWTKEEFEKDQETVQDKVTDAAKKTGEFASNQTDKVKSAAGSGAQKVKENTEPRVQ